MRRMIRRIAYGLAGLLFAVALTLAAYAVAGGGAAEPALPVDLADLAPIEVSGSPEPSGPPSPGIDVSGPCDEAEHAADPRCAAGGEEDDEDRSGSNSGPGSGG